MKKRILLLGEVNSVHFRKWVFEFSDLFDLAVFSFSPVESSQLRKEYEDNGVLIFTPEFAASSKMSYFLRFNLLKSAYRSFIPDLVHAHYATSYGLFGALLKPEKFLVSVWGSDVFQFPRKSLVHRRLLKFVFRRAHAVLSTSKVMANEISLYTDKKIHITPFGVDTDLFRPSSKKSETFVVGTVKGLSKIYGIDYLIKGFAQFLVVCPSAECHIYGKGPDELALKKLAEDLKIDSSVKFMGHVNHKVVPEVLSTFDVFCALSREESFGVAVLEASACSLPVVVSRAPGLKEVVKDKETGYIIDPSNSEETKSVLSRLYNNESERESMGQKGREFVVNNYSWRRSSEIMQNIYNELLNDQLKSKF
ncbi:MAG: glycosyltransferase [Brumimicrobium sp.]|nr:glycosyltransferase [Brumimicrobium sp.]